MREARHQQQGFGGASPSRLATPANYGVIATVRPVTPLAKSASVAPVRPARYALRWTDKNHPAFLSVNHAR